MTWNQLPENDSAEAFIGCVQRLCTFGGVPPQGVGERLGGAEGRRGPLRGRAVAWYPSLVLASMREKLDAGLIEANTIC